MAALFFGAFFFLLKEGECRPKNVLLRRWPVSTQGFKNTLREAADVFVAHCASGQGGGLRVSLEVIAVFLFGCFGGS